MILFVTTTTRTLSGRSFQFPFESSGVSSPDDFAQAMRANGMVSGHKLLLDGDRVVSREPMVLFPAGVSVVQEHKYPSPKGVLSSQDAD